MSEHQTCPGTDKHASENGDQKNIAGHANQAIAIPVVKAKVRPICM